MEIELSDILAIIQSKTPDRILIDDLDRDLYEYQLDSLDLTDIEVEIGERYGVEVPEVWEPNTVNGLFNCLKKL